MICKFIHLPERNQLGDMPSMGEHVPAGECIYDFQWYDHGCHDHSLAALDPKRRWGATWTQTRQRREIHSIQIWGMYIGVDSKTKLIHAVILPL